MKRTNFKLFFLWQTDSMLALEKEDDYKNEHFDFIQQQIRKFCLKCILLVIFK